MRKGQVSWFMLVALMILIVGTFIFHFNGKIYKKTENDVPLIMGTDFDSIRNYVEQCVKSSAQEAILTSAFQGGFYNETGNSLTYSFFVVPLYSYGKAKLAPSLQRLEEQVSFSAEEGTLICIDDFKVFKGKGFEIKFEKPVYRAKILDNEVFFEADFPINVINKEQITKSFDKFSLSVPSRYKLIYAIASQIADLQSQKPDKVCVSCLIDYASKNSLNITVSNFDNESVVFMIADKKVKIGNEELVFSFAHARGDLIA